MQETAPAGDFMDVFAPGFAAGSSRGLAAAASRPETFNTDRLFNEKPPDAIITFIIGGVRLRLRFRYPKNAGLCSCVCVCVLPLLSVTS
jgi:hypothetical protein